MVIQYQRPVPAELPNADWAPHALRQAETSAVFARYLGPTMAPRLVGRAPTTAETAKALRRTFDHLGSTYLKFGQLIGSSPGAFGPEMAAEFRSCLDDGTKVAYGDVRRIIEKSFGRGLYDIFATFEREPLASASMAVVHRATLPDGRDVAVKVIRPGVARQIALDLDIMKPLFKQLALAGLGMAGPLYRFISGFKTQVAEEIDLRNEARTMVHFRSLAADAGLDQVVIPEPVEGLIAADVLVMEFLDGVAIDDLDRIADFGHDPTPIVRQLLNFWFLTGLRDGMFHGDIHAGNLMVLRDGRLGLIDWGIVGVLDAPMRRVFRRFVQALLGDATAWADVGAFIEEMLPFQIEEGRGPLSDGGKQEIESILLRPFGEVDLTGAMQGPSGDDDRRRRREGAAPATKAEKRERRKKLKEMRKHMLGSGFADGELGQANFLLFKQLLYFERYGKLYLADQSLLGDADYLHKVLAYAES